MSDSSFDLILQELLHQQEIMRNLEAENRELHQQLANLREGRGIFVEIDGSRYPLISEVGNTGNIPTPTESFPTAPMLPVRVEQEEAPAFVTQEMAGAVDQQSFVEEAEPVAFEQQPTMSFQAEPVAFDQQPTMNFLLEDDEPITAFPFLQDTFEEEASAIATNKMAIWGESPTTPFPPDPSSQPDLKTEPTQKPVSPEKYQQQPALVDEDEKAVLRRELIGSFLLE